MKKILIIICSVAFGLAVAGCVGAPFGKGKAPVPPPVVTKG